MKEAEGSYVVAVDKLGTFSKGAVVTVADLAGQHERLLRKGKLRPATDDEVETGVVHFAGDGGAAARSLEQQLADQAMRMRLLEQENQELRVQLGEYRRAPAERTASVGPLPEDFKAAKALLGGEAGGSDEAGAGASAEYDTSILKGTVPEIVEYVTLVEDDGELRALKAAENARVLPDKPRKGVIDAIEERRGEIAKPE